MLFLLIYYNNIDKLIIFKIFYKILYLLKKNFILPFLIIILKYIYFLFIIIIFNNKFINLIFPYIINYFSIVGNLIVFNYL